MYVLQAIIGSQLEAHARAFSMARVVPIGQGLQLVPLTDKLWSEIGGGVPLDWFAKRSEAVENWASEISKRASCLRRGGVLWGAPATRAPWLGPGGLECSVRFMTRMRSTRHCVSWECAPRARMMSSTQSSWAGTGPRTSGFGPRGDPHAAMNPLHVSVVILLGRRRSERWHSSVPPFLRYAGRAWHSRGWPSRRSFWD